MPFCLIAAREVTLQRGYNTLKTTCGICKYLDEGLTALHDPDKYAKGLADCPAVEISREGMWGPCPVPSVREEMAGLQCGQPGDVMQHVSGGRLVPQEHEYRYR